MIAAITAILGFLASVAPATIGLFTQKENNAQQLRLKTLELQAAQAGYKFELEAEDARAATAQQQYLYAFDAGSSGNKFVDALRGAVRPYITLVVFHMWLAVELALLYYGI